MQRNGQYHLIPEYSLAVQDLVRHIRVYVFDTSNPDFAFLKKTGEKYQVITSEASATVLAIVNS